MKKLREKHVAGRFLVQAPGQLEAEPLHSQEHTARNTCNNCTASSRDVRRQGRGIVKKVQADLHPRKRNPGLLRRETHAPDLGPIS